MCARRVCGSVCAGVRYVCSSVYMCACGLCTYMYKWCVCVYACGIRMRVCLNVYVKVCVCLSTSACENVYIAEIDD